MDVILLPQFREPGPESSSRLFYYNTFGHCPLPLHPVSSCGDDSARGQDENNSIDDTEWTTTMIIIINVSKMTSINAMSCPVPFLRRRLSTPSSAVLIMSIRSMILWWCPFDWVNSLLSQSHSNSLFDQMEDARRLPLERNSRGHLFNPHDALLCPLGLRRQTETF